jgi:hypothetical protein
METAQGQGDHMENFKNGDRVFLETGQEAQYVGFAQGRGHIVQRVFEHDQEYGTGSYETLGRAEEVDRVHRTPHELRQKLDLEITVKLKTLEEVTAKGLQATKEALQFEWDQKERMARLKQHHQLERLDLFLEGKFQWIVIWDNYHGPKILPLNEALATDEDRPHKATKLLTLFGRTNGDLCWNLNRYSDSSAGWNESYSAIPCLTEEDARAEAQKVLNDHWEPLRAKGSYDEERWMKASLACGIPIPPDIQEGWDKLQVARADSAIEKAQAELSKAVSTKQALYPEWEKP